jgi:hypothetical protein
MSVRSATSLLLAALLLVAGSALAADPASAELHIRDQQFVPGQLTIAAGTKVELLVVNEDALPAEFESMDLSREVVVPGHSQVRIFIGPLDAGKYRFFNDFHQQSVGWIVAAAPAAAD